MESWREELYLRELYHSLDSPDPDELYHYGIPGMKWYIRRFQNADGSLTPRGRKHYGVGPPLEDGDFKEGLSLNKKYMRDRENYLSIKRSQAEKEDKKWEKKQARIKEIKDKVEKEAESKKPVTPPVPEGLDEFNERMDQEKIEEGAKKALEQMRTLMKAVYGEEDEGTVDSGAAFVESMSSIPKSSNESTSSTPTSSNESSKPTIERASKQDLDNETAYQQSVKKYREAKSDNSEESRRKEEIDDETAYQDSVRRYRDAKQANSEQARRKEEIDDETAYEQTVKKYRDAHRDNSEQARRKEEIDDETAYEQSVKKYREAHNANSKEARDLEEAARRRSELEEETRRQESVKKYRDAQQANSKEARDLEEAARRRSELEEETRRLESVKKYREAQRANSEEARELEDIRRKTERQKAENDLRAAQRAESEYRQQKLIEERQRTAKAYVDAASFMSKAGGAFSAGGGYMNSSVRNGRDFLSNQTWTRYSEKQLAKMSNDEFRQALDRMDLERRYSALTANDHLKGKQAASDLLYSMGALTSAASGVAGVAASLYSIKNKVSGGSGGGEKKK